MKTIPLTQGMVAIVDDDDWLYLSKHKWCYAHGGYASRGVCSQLANGRKDRKRIKAIYMHRVIMNPPDGLQIDHINGNKIDNRKVNLRFATMAENMRNRKIQSNNTTGFAGVAFDKRYRKKYFGRIRTNGVTTRTRMFSTASEAFDAKMEIIQQLHGEFTNLDRSQLCAFPESIPPQV